MNHYMQNPENLATTKRENGTFDMKRLDGVHFVASHRGAFLVGKAKKLPWIVTAHGGEWASYPVGHFDKLGSAKHAASIFALPYENEQNANLQAAAAMVGVLLTALAQAPQMAAEPVLPPEPPMPVQDVAPAQAPQDAEAAANLAHFQEGVDEINRVNAMIAANVRFPNVGIETKSERKRRLNAEAAKRSRANKKAAKAAQVEG